MNRSFDYYYEVHLACLFVIAFLVFNVLTATFYPYPNTDEAMIAEPAINFVHGQGFQVRFSEIVVMYPFLLVAWFKLFGSSLRSIRSADIICMTVSLLLLWSAVKRLEIVSSWRWRLFLLPLLATEYGMIFAYRSGRYDGFGALLMAGILWVMSIKEKRTRVASLSGICLFVPWAGPQFLPLIFIAGILLLMIFGWRYWREIAASYFSIVIGGVIFLAVLFECGRLASFLKFIRIAQRSSGFFHALISQGKFSHSNYIPKDFSFPFLFAAGVLLFMTLRRDRRVTYRSSIFYGLLFAVCLTSVLLLVAKFPTYYSYMIVVPVAVAVCSGLSLSEPGTGRNIALLLCSVSFVFGAVANVVAYVSARHDHNYGRIQNFVNQSVYPDDIVYTEPMAYEAVRARARDAYFPNPDLEIIPLMSQQQKEAIDVVLIRREWAPDVTKALGGTWEDTGRDLAPADTPFFGSTNLGFLAWKFVGLHVYRRCRRAAFGETDLSLLRRWDAGVRRVAFSRTQVTSSTMISY